MHTVTQMLRCYLYPVKNSKRDVPASEKKTPAYILQAEEMAEIERRVGSNWKPWGGPTLLLDVETTTDLRQTTRFGVYQLRGHDYSNLMEFAKRYHREIPREVLDKLKHEGIFYNSADGVCTDDEIAIMRTYAEQHGLRFLTMAEFIRKVFYRAYTAKGWRKVSKKDANGNKVETPEPIDTLPCMVVGHNLPFDLGGMAYDVSPARMGNYGELTLKLQDCASHVVIRRLGFAKHMYSTHAKFGRLNHVFVNTQQLGRALFGASVTSSLAGIARALGLAIKKGSADYKGPITTEYIGYCRNDVELTWQVYKGLSAIYMKHGFTALNNKGVLARPIDKIYSEASIGKGYFEQLGMKPFLENNPGFDHTNVTAPFMATMYGGRSEVRCRLDLRQGMQADFKSQYPTCNALMKLQELNIAKTIKVVMDDTGHGPAAQFLHSVTLADLQDKETWPKLRGVALIDPSGCILPVRTVYHVELEHETSAKAQQIGVNEVVSGPLCWYTFADIIASKMLTGRTPKIIQTITLEPVGIQDGLKPHMFFGDPKYTIDLTKDDLFQRLIDMRSEVKKLKADGWEPKEQGIKLTANGTSYGVLIEFIVDERDEPTDMMVFAPGRTKRMRANKVVRSADGSVQICGFKVERPGKWFAPWGALIPAAGRLLLAVAERLAKDRGIYHGFCDTDSMFFIRPDGVEEQEFINKVKEIVSPTGWFQKLNPYASNDPVFALEAVNHPLVRDEQGNLKRVQEGDERGKPIVDKSQIELPWLLAVSAKRYGIANKYDGKWIIRKASGHGLGHITAPYYDKDKLPPHIAATYKVQEDDTSPLWFGVKGVWSEGSLCKGSNPKLFVDLWRLVFGFVEEHKAGARTVPGYEDEPIEDLEDWINIRMDMAVENMDGLHVAQLVQQSISSRDEWLSHKTTPWRRAFGFYNSVPAPVDDNLLPPYLSIMQQANRRDLLSTSFYTEGGKDVRILSLEDYKAKGNGEAQGLYRRDNGQFPDEMFKPEYGLKFQTVAQALELYFTHLEFKSEGKYGLLPRRKLVILNQEMIGKESHDILHNPDDPELDDEDLLNRRIVMTWFNTALLRQFGVTNLSKVLLLSEGTVRKNLLHGFPMSDAAVSRLRRSIVVDADGRAKLVKPEPPPIEKRRALTMQRQLMVVRRSLSSKGNLASFEAVIEAVLKHVTPETAALVQKTKDVDVERVKRVLGPSIPFMLDGEMFPNVKFLPAFEQVIRVASGAAAHDERLAKLKERTDRAEYNKRRNAVRIAKRAETRQAVRAIQPTMEYIDHPITGLPILVSPDEAKRERRREQVRNRVARFRAQK
jgi:hypothetical protein